MNPNLLNYNYRPVNSSTIPILPSSTSSTSSISSSSSSTRLNQVHCLSSTDPSINSGMINEMQTSSSYLPLDDNNFNFNFFHQINDSDNCSTMAPNQMASNDLISDQSHQQLAGTTNDHPYSRVERDSRTDHQLTPINNSYVSNSSNLQADRINSNSIGGNSHHQSLHSHSTHHHHHHSPQQQQQPQQQQHLHQHQHQSSQLHQQPLHPSHQRHQQQHSMSHHLLTPHSQSSHSVPHQSMHNYVQQSNSNHNLYNPNNYLTRPPNIINHGSPEQCRGQSSPNPSPGGSSLHEIVYNSDSPITASPASASTASLVAPTASPYLSSTSQSTNSSQETKSSQGTSSQKSDDLSQKANQSFNSDSDLKKLADTLDIPSQLAEPPPPPPPTFKPPKPEVIDVLPSKSKEEKKTLNLRINTTAALTTSLSPPGMINAQFDSITITRVIHRLSHQGRIIAETVVDERELTVPMGIIRLNESDLEQKSDLTIHTTGQVKCDFPYPTASKKSVIDGAVTPNSTSNIIREVTSTPVAKGGSGLIRKSNKSFSSEDSGYNRTNSTVSSSNSLTAITESTLPTTSSSITSKSSNNKRKASSLASASSSSKRVRKHGKRIVEEKEIKRGLGGVAEDSKTREKDRETKSINKEELIDNEEAASVLLSLHGDSSLLRKKESVITDIVHTIDTVREPVFRPIEKDNQVFAKWARDKNFYPGKASSPQSDSKWLITFDDGERRSVHESEIISILYLVPGQHVMLTYTNDSCVKRVIKRCFVRENGEVEYEVENDETRYPTRKLFLTSDMAAILLGKQAKLPSNASKFADVDLNNIIPSTKRSRISKPATSSSAPPPSTTSSSSSSVIHASINSPATVVSQPLASDDPCSFGDSDTSSVNSVKSTKCRSTSFSKQFLPTLSPSSNRSSDVLSHKTKKSSTISKHPPPLPFSYKKSSDSLSIASSSSSLKNERSSGKLISSSVTISASKPLPAISHHQGEKEKLLGPIPPQGSTLFAGIGFLLTTTNRTNKSNGEMSSSEAGSSIPFDADYLTTQIQMGSGRIFADVDSARKCTEINETVLIAYTYLKSSLYMQCLHGGIPCIMHTWVIECCREGQLLQKSKYLLPSGYSLIKSNLSSDKNVFKKSAYLFKGLKIMIADNKLIDKWKPVLDTGSANIVSSLPASTGSSTRKATNSVDLIVADANCPTTIIKKAQQMNIPIVTSEYLAQCLINGRKLSHDSHEDFKYK